MDEFCKIGNSNYSVSKDGKIRNDKTGKHLKYIIRKPGYASVMLSPLRRLSLVHRLVAEAFIPNPDKHPQVNHKNEIKTDNRVENLEWCSNSYNMTYNDRHIKAVSKISKPVIQIGMDGEVVCEFLSTHDASRRTGLTQSRICDCCNGKHKTYKGYVWKYKNNQRHLPHKN